MSPWRETVVLPVLFLTVLLAGGWRFGQMPVLQPPSPFALILGLLLLRVLIQSGALHPGRLVGSGRSALANVNGAVVLGTLWAAGAQTLALLIPESGLPRLAFNVYFVMLLLNTAAAAPDRQRLLRSLAVTFGGAFVLKFVVLHELSAPGSGWLKGVVQAMLQGVTLGSLLQEVPHPAAAYVALLTVGLFLVGVVLLPQRPAARRLPPGEQLALASDAEVLDER